MRSIAHEIGQLLGCGAHLESLRRTGVAEFDVIGAHTLEEIENRMRIPRPTAEACHSDRSFALPKGNGNGAEEPAVSGLNDTTTLFVHPRQLLPQFPSVTADEAAVARIHTGRSVNLPELSRSRLVKVFRGQSDLIAIATRIAGTLFHPKIVFPDENQKLKTES